MIRASSSCLARVWSTYQYKVSGQCENKTTSLTAVDQFLVIPVTEVCDNGVFTICIAHLSGVAPNLVEFNPWLLNAFTVNVSITPMVRNIVLFPTCFLIVSRHMDNRNTTFNLSYEILKRMEIVTVIHLLIGMNNKIMGK